jgi:2,4-dichlorophenol 6-monooxygenase
MSTEYLSHVQDADGVTTTCRDRLTGKDCHVRSKYLVGADGGNSLVAEHAGLPFEGKMGVGGSMNILFRADLSRLRRAPAQRALLGHAARRGCGRDRHGAGPDGPAVERMADRLGLRHQPSPRRWWTRRWRRRSPPAGGCRTLEIDLISANTWTVNNCYATHMQRAASSSWAMPRTGIRRRTGWGRTPRSRTASTWRGSWRRW